MKIRGLRNTFTAISCVMLVLSFNATGYAACNCQKNRSCTCRMCVSQSQNAAPGCTCESSGTDTYGGASGDVSPTAYSFDDSNASDLQGTMEVEMADGAEGNDAIVLSSDMGAGISTYPDTETESDPVIRIFGPGTIRRSFSQEVRNLQIYLNAYFQTDATIDVVYLEENGIFDKETEQALRRFQIVQGIHQEIGYAGDETKIRLFELMGNLIY